MVILQVGTGLGPTLEFYALVSKEVQKSDLDLWRGEGIKEKSAIGQLENLHHSITVHESCWGISINNWCFNIMKIGTNACTFLINSIVYKMWYFFLGLGEDEEILYCYSPCGLFPAPLPRNAKAAVINKVKAKFKFLGKFMAKALMDSRMVNIYRTLYFLSVLHREKTITSRHETMSKFIVKLNVKFVVLLHYLQNYIIQCTRISCKKHLKKLCELSFLTNDLDLH